jgi:hypothetical protein
MEFPSFEPGTYYMYADIDWDSQSTQSISRDFCVNCYGPPVEFLGDESSNFEKNTAMGICGVQGGRGGRYY